jgi:hypothetical protein
VESTETVFVDGTGVSYSVTERSSNGYFAGPVGDSNGSEGYSTGP